MNKTFRFPKLGIIFFFVLLHFSFILLIIGMDFKMDWSNMTSPATYNRCFILKIDVSMPLDWH